jgi:hypothetical protein
MRARERGGERKTETGYLEVFLSPFSLIYVRKLIYKIQKEKKRSVCDKEL